MSKKFVGFWNVSVILTYIELCIAVGSICAAADGKVWPAVSGLALCGLCDMFDGKIARSRGLITNLGKFLDPLADKMLTTAAFLGFLAAGRLDVWAVMIILTREFMVTSVRLVAAKDGTVIAASLAGKAKTVAQFASILYMLAALEFCSWEHTLLAGTAVPGWLFDVLPLVGQALIWVSVVLTVISGFQYVWSYRQYFTSGG